MPISKELLRTVTTGSSEDAWNAISDHLWQAFSPAIAPAVSDAEVVKRDRGLTELDNVLSGSAWELWRSFESEVPTVAQAVLNFWSATQAGKAVLLLDGLSLREIPWILGQADERGYTVHKAMPRGVQLPPETTAFANSLGFAQRSALENNGAGGAHKLKGAVTDCCNLPWQECVDRIGNHEALVFWHHWPDERMHDLSGPGLGLSKLAKETHKSLTSDDFWALIERLTTGRRLVITSDHGYAASGLFPDLMDKSQVGYMKAQFKSGRFSADGGSDGSWVPPIDLRLTTGQGTNRYVLGRRKWKSAGGYPTLTHGGLSLLEVFVPFIEISK